MQQPDAPSPEALAAHRRVLIPLFGALFTARQLATATGEADRAVLAAAAKWQGFGASVVLMHAALQIAVEAVRWMHAVGPGLGEPLDSAVPWVLLGATWLNVGSGLAEYAFVVFWGLRAASGHELPFLGGRRRGRRRE